MNDSIGINRLRFMLVSVVVWWDSHFQGRTPCERPYIHIFRAAKSMNDLIGIERLRFMLVSIAVW